MSLATFFDASARYLTGAIDAAAFQAALGDPAPPGAGLALYSRLVHEGPRRRLGEIFPVTRLRCGEALWEGLGDAYLREHPACHWDVNRSGAPFPEALARARPDRPDLAELADFEWTGYLAMHHPDPFDPSGDDVNPSLSVRHYRFAVPAFARACLDGPPPAELPEGPVTLFLFCEPHHARLRLQQPTRGELLALAWARHELPFAELERVAPRPELEAGLAALAALGVIGSALARRLRLEQP